MGQGGERESNSGGIRRRGGKKDRKWKTERKGKRWKSKVERFSDIGEAVVMRDTNYGA